VLSYATAKNPFGEVKLMTGRFDSPFASAPPIAVVTRVIEEVTASLRKMSGKKLVSEETRLLAEDRKTVYLPLGESAD
jgi:hypothetical protein